MGIRMTEDKFIKAGEQGGKRRTRWAFVMLARAGIILLIGIAGMPQSSASNQYGILGLKAPELGLNTWINGDGKPMDPVEIGDYRGKVIYLYFFQDW